MKNKFLVNLLLKHKQKTQRFQNFVRIILICLGSEQKVGTKCKLKKKKEYRYLQYPPPKNGHFREKSLDHICNPQNGHFREKSLVYINDPPKKWLISRNFFFNH